MRRSPELPVEPRQKIKRTGVQVRERYAVAKEIQSNVLEMPPSAGPSNLGNPLQPLFPSTVGKLL